MYVQIDTHAHTQVKLVIELMTHTPKGVVYPMHKSTIQIACAHASPHA